MQKLTADNGTKWPRQSWTPILSSFFARRRAAHSLNIEAHSYETAGGRQSIGYNPVSSLSRTILRHSVARDEVDGRRWWLVRRIFFTAYLHAILHRGCVVLASRLRFRSPCPTQVKRRQLPFVLVLFLSLSLSFSAGHGWTRPFHYA